MNIVDFTHVIEPSMPVYPGTEPPRLQPANTYAKDGFQETLLELYSHTGTHMDAPCHIFEGLPSLDRMDASRFVGQALVVDCRAARAGEQIGMEYLTPVRPLADRAEYVLFQTGWDRYWGRPEYYGDYPVLSPEVVDYLLDQKKKGVGLDLIGIDPIRDEALPIHRRILSTGCMVILENLTNLDAAGRDLFTFCALPLHYRNADGAPVRAVGILP